MYFLLLLLYFFFSTFLCELTLKPKVEIYDGIVSGTTYKTVFGKEIYAFFGVPYAAPPIGDIRFEFPKPVQRWKGEWNATYQTNACIQYTQFSFQVIGEEDCLYLDIYTPKLPITSSTTELMDVIVYIPGGAFMFSSGHDKQPDYLLDENDLVYITINYRLGPLGFLSTGDDIVPGNNGLKDQSTALRWVQQNIAKFGGNPARVTIVGESAGGASVHYHYISPMSKGLFSQGISQGGSSLTPWALAEEVPEKSKRLASLLECPTHCSREMIECLKQRPAKQILKNIKEFQPWLYNPSTPFGPTIESYGKNRFLTEKPIDIIRSGKIKNLPWLASVTRDEGLCPIAQYIQDQSIKEFDNNWNNIAPYLLDYNYSVPYEIRDKISKTIQDHFFKNEQFNVQNYQILVKVIGDRLTKSYIEFTIKEQIKSVSSPVYYYKFNYAGKYSISNVYDKNNMPYGVSHADDCLYALKYASNKPHEIPADLEMIKLMVSIWISFVRTSVPLVNNNKWLPNTKESLKDGIIALEINNPNNLTTSYIRDTSSFDFWNSILNEFQDVKLKTEL